MKIDWQKFETKIINYSDFIIRYSHLKSLKIATQNNHKSVKLEFNKIN